MNLLIVNFHYFSNEVFPSGIYPVNHGQLANQVSQIGKSYQFISPAKLAECFINKDFPEGNYCLITFDDGLKEQMLADELLKSLKIEAAFYVATQPLLENNVLDVHKLQLIRSRLADNDLLVELKKMSDYSYTIEDEKKAVNQYKYDDMIAREVKFQLNFKLSSEKKSYLLHHLFEQIFGSEHDYSTMFYMNEKEIKKLASSNQLGAHGHLHAPLTRIANPYQDIKQSIDCLKQITNKHIQSFSYPYGSSEAVDTKVAQMVQSLGLNYALTMWRGFNKIDANTNPFLLSRVDTNDAPGGKNNSSEFILNEITNS